MSMFGTRTRRNLALGAATLIAVPTVLLTTGAAQAAPTDVEREGACGAGRYDVSVDREGRGWEIDTQLEGLERGERWRIVLRHDGDRVVNRVLTADFEGEIDVDRFQRDTAGKDTFRFAATKVGGGASCATTITVG